MLDDIVVHTINNNLPPVEIIKEDHLMKWIPIISPIIVLIVFFLGQYIDSRKRRKESKRALYYKIHLEPAIEELNIFFKEIDTLVLAQNGEVRLDTQEVPRTLVRIKKRIGDMKRSFEDSSLLILQPRYPEVFKQATNILIKFQDDVYTIIEIGDNHGDIDYKAHRSMARRDLISTLSEPVLGTKSKKRLFLFYKEKS